MAPQETYKNIFWKMLYASSILSLLMAFIFASAYFILGYKSIYYDKYTVPVVSALATALLFCVASFLYLVNQITSGKKIPRKVGGNPLILLSILMCCAVIIFIFSSIIAFIFMQAINLTLDTEYLNVDYMMYFPFTSGLYVLTIFIFIVSFQNTDV